MIGWRLLCGWLVFIAISTTVSAGVATLAGRLTVPGVWLALILGVIAAIFTMRGATAPRQKITNADIILLVVFALASLRAFLWVIFQHGDALMVLSPHNLGDMALHLNLIHRWANGGAFWPDNPFLAGATFAYHPGMDLWNALLRVAGIPIYEGLRWAGLLGAVATATALWRWGRGFAMAGFLFAGGLGTLAYFFTLHTDATQADIAWKNLFLAMFVTQRGLLYSLPAGLVLMTTWRTFLNKDASGPQLPVLAQVALYASMPLFNAPAFLFLSAILAACALVGWRVGIARMFVVIGVVSLLPATWLVRMVTANFSAPSALRFSPGWMPGGGSLEFWLQNFGLFLPLVVALGVVLWGAPSWREIGRTGQTERTARVFFVMGAGTLGFSFLFVIAPWPWDNTKLILWGYLALLPFLETYLLRRFPEWIREAVYVLLFAAGAVALVAGLDVRHGYLFAKREELASMQMMLRRMPVDARLACAPGYEHPALLLGQPVAMGYEGHLYSQGLDYAPVQQNLDCLMNGAEGWRQAARHLGVRYLFWGEREKQMWPQSQQPWITCAPKLSFDKFGTLYLLTPCFLED